MNESAVANGRKDRGERKFGAQNFCAQVAMRHGHCIARAECDGFKGAIIFAQGRFALGAAVEIVEDGSRQAALGPAAQIFNVDDARRRDGARPLIHSPPNWPQCWTWREALYSTNTPSNHAWLDFRRDTLCSRANGAEDASPGQRPEYLAQITLSALKGRRVPAPFQGATCDCTRHPGRCPGLACAGAFSAGNRARGFECFHNQSQLCSDWKTWRIPIFV